MEDNSWNDWKNGKKLVPMKLLNATTSLRQSEKVTLEKQDYQNEDESTDNVNKKKYVIKLHCQSKQVYVEEVVKLFEASFQEVLGHVNKQKGSRPKNLKLTRTKRM